MMFRQPPISYLIASKTLLPLGFVLAVGCSANATKTQPKPALKPTKTLTAPSSNGTTYALSTHNYVETAALLDATLNQIKPVSVVATLDHSENARGATLKLNPARVVFFGNPKLGTPLMQKNQLAGLDLPQRMVVYEQAPSEVYVMYNSAQYLRERHGLEGVASLPTIGNALKTISVKATGAKDVLVQASTVRKGEGIVTTISAHSVDETYNRLKKAIASKGVLSVVFELDHAANAAKVGMTLRPTKVIAFGNPKMGTPLMQSRLGAGLDLPQKMLVWQDADGKVRVAYNDPKFLAKRHGVDAVLEKMSGALRGLADAATDEDPTPPIN